MFQTLHTFKPYVSLLTHTIMGKQDSKHVSRGIKSYSPLSPLQYLAKRIQRGGDIYCRTEALLVFYAPFLFTKDLTTTYNKRHVIK